MSFNIITKYTNVNGAGKVKATGLGKQKTTAWDHSLTREQNFANAAAALLLANGYTAQGVDPTAYGYREGDGAHIFTMAHL